MTLHCKTTVVLHVSRILEVDMNSTSIKASIVHDLTEVNYLRRTSLNSFLLLGKEQVKRKSFHFKFGHTPQSLDIINVCATYMYSNMLVYI